MTEKIYIQDNDKLREATAKEIAQLEEIRTAHNLIEAERLARIEAKESAFAKLKKIGLTDEEIEALLP
jgi:hypothetical protein